MNVNLFNPPQPPTLSPADVAARRQHLIGEIQRAKSKPRIQLAPTSLSRAGVIIIAASLVVVAAAGGTALALKGDLFDSTPAPTVVGDRVDVATGPNWAVEAWKSTRGMCLGVVISDAERAVGCGFPVVGTPPVTDARVPQPNHEISGMYTSQNGDGNLYVAGVIADSVSRVEVEFRDGHVANASIYRAPSSLSTSVNFFVLRTQLSSADPFPIAGYRAYDDAGHLLERYPVPRPPVAPTG
jgi:hypothetical protein